MTEKLVRLGLEWGCGLSLEEAWDRNPEVREWLASLDDIDLVSPEGIALQAGPVAMSDLLGRRYEEEKVLSIADRYNRLRSRQGIDLAAEQRERSEMIALATVFGRELVRAALPTLPAAVWLVADLWKKGNPEAQEEALSKLFYIFRNEDMEGLMRQGFQTADLADWRVEQATKNQTVPGSYLPKLFGDVERPNCIGQLIQAVAFFKAIGAEICSTDIIVNGTDIADKAVETAIGMVEEVIETYSLWNDREFADSLAAHKERLSFLWNGRFFHSAPCVRTNAGQWWVFDPYCKTLAPLTTWQEEQIGIARGIFQRYGHVLPTLDFGLYDREGAERKNNEWLAIVQEWIDRSLKAERLLSGAQDFEEFCWILADPAYGILEWIIEDGLGDTDLAGDSEIVHYLRACQAKMSLSLLMDEQGYWRSEDPLRCLREKGIVTFIMCRGLDEMIRISNGMHETSNPFHPAMRIAADPFTDIGVSVINSLALEQREHRVMRDLAEISPSQVQQHNYCGDDFRSLATAKFRRCFGLSIDEVNDIDPVARRARRTLERAPIRQHLCQQKLARQRAWLDWEEKHI